MRDVNITSIKGSRWSGQFVQRDGVLQHVDASDRARFAAKVAAPDERGCTRWLGKPMPTGYGQFIITKRGAGTKSERMLHVYAHRLAWILANNRDLPSGNRWVVCHSCDVPLCVNPAHLFIGAQADNMRDMSRKGRGRKSVRQSSPQQTDSNLPSQSSNLPIQFRG